MLATTLLRARQPAALLNPTPSKLCRTLQSSAALLGRVSTWRRTRWRCVPRTPRATAWPTASGSASMCVPADVSPSLRMAGDVSVCCISHVATVLLPLSAVG